ncbi:MAG: hypothetical protein QOF33_733 [Thermomicrobiales bacterium]|nr:hypothetical protein [Thermomicrobiales bacterium]
MDNPFSWDYLTTTPGPDEVFGPFAVIFLIVFAVGFLVAVAVYSGGGGKTLIPNPVLRRMARRWSGWALTVFGLGLFFFAIRWLQINPLSFGSRIWLWISWLTLLALVVLIAYDIRAHYASAKLAYEEHRRKQQYLRPTTAGATTTGRSTSHGAPLAAGPRPVKRRKR